MSSDNSKSGSKPASKGSGDLATDAVDKGSKSTGRVKFDDRGNAIWEWQITTGAFSPEVSTQRLQKLQHPALSIADDAPTPAPDQVRANPLGTKKGYDPYDSGKLAKEAVPPRKKDLRKLSEWMKLKKQAGTLKDDDSED